MNATVINSELYAKLKRLNQQKKEITAEILPFGSNKKQFDLLLKINRKISKTIDKL